MGDDAIKAAKIGEEVEFEFGERNIHKVGRVVSVGETEYAVSVDETDEFNNVFSRIYWVKE
jgi:hypothetical protein